MSDFCRLQYFNMNSTGECTQVKDAIMNTVPSTGSPSVRFVTFILICSNFRALIRYMGCIGSWWGNRREGDHWGDLGVDGWIILGWISRRWDVGIWTGLG